MRKTILCLLILFMHELSQAQVTPVQSFKQDQAIYLEAFGTGGLYSLNYERMLLQRKSIALAGRAGLTFTPRISGFSEDVFGPGIPLEINFLYGQSHHLELGAGITMHYLFYRPDGPIGVRNIGNNEFEYIYGEPYDYIIGFASMRLGYRYQKPGKGFLFRIGFTPLFPFSGDEKIEIDSDSAIIPMGGISVGYAF